MTKCPYRLEWHWTERNTENMQDNAACQLMALTKLERHGPKMVWFNLNNSDHLRPLWDMPLGETFSVLAQIKFVENTRTGPMARIKWENFRIM